MVNFNSLFLSIFFLLFFFSAKHCKTLTPSGLGHSLSIPCFTSFGSKCHFGCANGFSMKGDGQASCSVVSTSGTVSWKVNEFSCKGRTTTIKMSTAFHTIHYCDSSTYRLPLLPVSSDKRVLSKSSLMF